MNALTITGGRIIDPANGVDAHQDLHLLNGRVLARGPAPEGFVPEQRLDVQGQWILPGLIDLCARPLGDFGQELRAAAAGGVTSLCVPPEISPCIDTPAVAERLLEQARREGRARLHPVGALTRALEKAPAVIDVVTTQQAVSSDAQKGLGFVPDYQPLTAWDEAERKRRL